MAAHRAAILQAAGRRFRRRGIEAVTVADVTAGAGLTHGAFYGHFSSKTALAAESCHAALADGAALWRRRAARARDAGTDPIGALVDAYLSEQHRDAPETGCVLATLGPELARAAPPLGGALRAGVEDLVGVLHEELLRVRPGLPENAARDIALAMLSAMVGGLILARLCRDDDAASRAALANARRLALAAAFQPEIAS